MSGNKDKRLAKLERKRPAGETFIVWRDREAGWTVEEAIARRFRMENRRGGEDHNDLMAAPGESQAEGEEWLRLEQAKP